MKNTIAIDLFGTIVSIPEVTLSISPLLRERLLTQEKPIVPSFLKRIFDQQKNGIELFDESLEFLRKASETHNLICMSNLSSDFKDSVDDLGFPSQMKYLFSFEFGFKKPQPIFYEKIKRMSAPGIIYTIGDGYLSDYWKPRLAGLKGYWLNREPQAGLARRRHEVRSLMEFYNIIALNP